MTGHLSKLQDDLESIRACEPYRNYFHAGPWHDDMPDLDELERMLKYAQMALVP